MTARHDWRRQPALTCVNDGGALHERTADNSRGEVESHASSLARLRTVPLAPEPLELESVEPEPIAQFRRWYGEAVAAGVAQPDAMTLATAAPNGAVSARTVLLRGLDERGFVFFTNLDSAKSSQL